MNQSVAFYETLGATRAGTVEIGARITQLTVGDGSLDLLANENTQMPDVGSRAYLILVVSADGSIDRIHQACKDQGFAFGFEVRDDGFGRFFLVHDPDGYRLTINERAETRRHRNTGNDRRLFFVLDDKHVVDRVPGGLPCPRSVPLLPS